MDLWQLLTELEHKGRENDAVETDRARRYLNITRDTGEFLALMVKATGARTLLEVGTSNGYSALWLAKALPPGGHLYTIERQASKAAEARRHFAKAGLSGRINLLEGDLAQQLDAVPGELDLIFLDADRSTYLPLAERFFSHLRAGGLLICDNAVSHQEEMAEFSAWVDCQAHLSKALVPVGKGELLVYKGQ